MALWKHPPKAKVYEALSALADGRVILEDGNHATVLSSNAEKKYRVEWTPGFASMSSNDNASFWQGYAGYPIIAVLLAGGVFHFDASTAELLAGVDWNRINKEYKRDYDRAVSSVLDRIEANGGNRAEIVSTVDRIYSELCDLKIEKVRSAGPARPD